MTLLIQRPIICYCSGSQTHKINHIECRCDGWERFRQAASDFVKKLDPIWPRECKPKSPRTDEDGYPLCKYCGKIRFKNWLVQCPYCDRYFKGPKFWFNKKFHYECEDCG